MILDALAQLADGLAVTDADAYTTYSYDLGNVTPKREVGEVEPLALVFTVGVAAAGSTDTSYLKAVQDTSAAMDSGSVTEIASRLIANASLTAGSIHVVPIPPGSVSKRYIAGRIELGSGDTITVDCYVVPQTFIQGYKSYADNVAWS